MEGGQWALRSCTVARNRAQVGHEAFPATQRCCGHGTEVLTHPAESGEKSKGPVRSGLGVRERTGIRGGEGKELVPVIRKQLFSFQADKGMRRE